MEWISAGVLEPGAVLLLIGLAGLTSLMTAALGIGGGALLLVVMASLLPVTALIPVHGLVQLGSNANRACMTRHHIDWPMVRFFALGALLGALLASVVVVQLPLMAIELAVAGFILFLVWGPKPQAREMSPLGRVVAGAVTTLLSMFVGATGPMVAGLVHRNAYDKLQLTATFACCMSFQHGLKGVVFSIVGFAFWQWLPLTLLMILSGTLGTWLGLKLLRRIPGQRFKLIFQWVVTLLALRLLWHSLQGLF